MKAGICPGLFFDQRTGGGIDPAKGSRANPHENWPAANNVCAPRTEPRVARRHRAAWGSIVTGLAIFVASPEWQIAHLPRAQPGNPLMTWFAFLWIGMGAIGTLSIWFRGVYLIAPMVGWTIFWAGGNLAHVIHDPGDGHPLTLHGFLHLSVAHGLIALLLVGFGVAMWRRKGRPPV